MATLAALVASAAMLTGTPCAGIDNGINQAVWTTTGRSVVVTTYNGDDMVYQHALPTGRTLKALRLAEAKLSIGKPSHKVRIACAN